MSGSISRTAVGGVAVLVTSLLGGYPALAQGTTAAARDFQHSVEPFLAQHCFKCHGLEKQESSLRLDNLDGDLIKGPHAQVWNDVRAKLLAGEMPPPKQPRPPVADMQRVVDFLTAGLQANGKVTLRQPPDFNHPRFGNRIDHDALFQPRPGTVASSPVRVWRLSSFGYTGLASGLHRSDRFNPTATIIQPFSSGGGQGFQDYAALLQIDEPTITQLLNNAAAIV